MAMVKRFEIYLFNMDPDSADKTKNTRPCVIISPNEMNEHLESVIIAPLSNANRPYPTRINFEFLNKKRAIIADQIRTVDKERLVKKIGEVKGNTKRKILDILQEMFTM
jgi:mRNA interferase MazF